MKKSKGRKGERGFLSVLENLTLKNKMVLMLIIPILALVFFAQSEMRQSMSLVAENEKIGTLAQFSVKASVMVDERPWTEKPQASSGPIAEPQKKTALVGSSDEDWEDF